MTSKLLFQVTFILRRPRVANFADIIKIAIIFNRKTFKDENKVKRNRKLQISGKYADVSKIKEVIYTFF